MALPALRNVDISQVQHERQTYVCLRDADGFVQEQLILSPEAFFIAAHLDGINDVSDIQYHFVNHFAGAVVSPEDVGKVVDYLEEQGFLQSDRFEAIRHRVEQAFAQAEDRPAYLAGKTYPDDPTELRAFLDELFVRDGGPGEKPGQTHGSGAPPRCLVVPHIDFDRGGAAYAHGYLRMFKQGRPKTVFIFGVAHGLSPVPFILTKKSFQTPFGTVRTDQEAVERLAAACAWDPYAHEIAHRTEHSIEFQVVTLAYLYGAGFRIVPVLCGAFSPDELQTSDNPESLEDVNAFLDSCRTVIASADGAVTLVAAADLAHVGRRFGDAFDIDDAVVGAVEARDREDLAYVTALDPDGFYRSVMKDDNARQVCGLNCIYAAIRAVAGSAKQGELLHYGHAPDPAGGLVSFASVLLS